MNCEKTYRLVKQLWLFRKADPRYHSRSTPVWSLPLLLTSGPTHQHLIPSSSLTDELVPPVLHPELRLAGAGPRAGPVTLRRRWLACGGARLWQLMPASSGTCAAGCCPAAECRRWSRAVEHALGSELAPAAAAACPRQSKRARWRLPSGRRSRPR